MRPEDVRTCSGAARRRAVPGLGREHTLSGAEGSSGWGAYEGAGLGGVFDAALTSEDVLLRGPADTDVWAVKLGDTPGTLGHLWNPSPQFPCVRFLELTTHFAASMERKTTEMCCSPLWRPED